MRYLYTGFFLLGYFLSIAQNNISDWDAYLMEVNNKPVSIIVDLGLASVAPQKERPFVVIIRTKILKPDPNGLPGKTESVRLDEMENKLVEQLSSKTGAVYTGRYTQRGLREFYFYALDTLDYFFAVKSALAGFTDYQWLTQAKEDKKWTNYFTVLYPPPVEYEKIQNRRMVDLLKGKGDELKESRRIDHFFYFKTKSKREDFLRSPGMENFSIDEIPEANQKKALPYMLHIFKNDVPDYSFIERVLIPLWERAKQFEGNYDGWETYLVK
jgi:uncharacterized protein (TIGR01619 family)